MCNQRAKVGFSSSNGTIEAFGQLLINSSVLPLKYFEMALLDKSFTATAHVSLLLTLGNPQSFDFSHKNFKVVT